MSDHHPNWDVDRPWGDAGADYVEQVFAWPGISKIEVKRKRRIDEHIYVELEQNPFEKGWRPSGLAVTEADLWAWVIASTGAMVLFRTDHLCAAVCRPRKWIRKAAEEDGEAPTRGLLIHVPSLLEWISVQYGPFGGERFLCEDCDSTHALREHDRCRQANGEPSWAGAALRRAIKKLEAR